MKPSSFVREIPITDVPGLRIGHAENEEAKTGVTVLIFDQGAAAGVDISGGGPASRETPLTSPVTADNPLNAIVLSGGSAFGLAASDGVMRYLEEHGMGYPTGFANVPLVCQYPPRCSHGLRGLCSGRRLDQKCLLSAGNLFLRS